MTDPQCAGGVAHWATVHRHDRCLPRDGGQGLGRQGRRQGRFARASRRPSSCFRHAPPGWASQQNLFIALPLQ